MRPLNCLDRSRDINGKPGAPFGGAPVQVESTADRLARVLREAMDLPEDSAAARRWRAYWSYQGRR